MISELEMIGYEPDKDTLVVIQVVVKGGNPDIVSRITEHAFHNYANRADVKTNLNVHRPSYSPAKIIAENLGMRKPS